MFQENKTIENILRFFRHLIPRRIFEIFKPIYHWSLSMLGALMYGFPSRSMKVIAVTGTKGKSTVVFMLGKIFEDAGYAVASIGSLGMKIKNQTWPNTLKMTMPGRLKLQSFLAQARQARVQYCFLEATSEGIAQHRLAGIHIDCAVFTNLHPEHIESHGSFARYQQAKEKLFKKTRNIHVLNIDDTAYDDFNRFKARQKITYGIKQSEHEKPTLQLLGDFNQYNALAALAIANAYGISIDQALRSLAAIEGIAGRMEVLTGSDGLRVVVDYAHTPESLEAVYRNLREELATPENKLICVLGSAGGGRDTWKRPVFGAIASHYCDQLILTNEDPFDEDPQKIIDDIQSGIKPSSRGIIYEQIIDRKQAIETAIKRAHPRDIVVITGKGSETSMAIAGGKKIPWSDRDIAQQALKD